MDRLFLDLRHALRSLARNRGHSAAVIATWALGLGATLTLFTVVWNVVLEPLPVPEPERLVIVYQTDPHNASFSEAASLPDFRDYREASDGFAALAGVRSLQKNLQTPARDDGGVGAERVKAVGASPELFRMLGFRAVEGRLFGSAEERGGARVAVLGPELWQRRFGGDPAVVGERISLDGEQYTVVGVGRTGLAVPQDADLWIPLSAAVGELGESRGVHNVLVLGLLAPGRSRQAVQAEMDALAARLAEIHPETNENRGARLVPLREAVVGEVRPALLTLLGAVGLLLLIAGTNAAGLMLARTARRAREMGVRAALGADRLRLLRQLLFESVVLSGAAGALGLLAAAAVVELLGATTLELLPRAGSVAVDPVVAAVGLGLALAVGALFGLLPAARVSRRAVTEALRGVGATVRGRPGRRGRGALVVAQVALAAMLAVGAGLLVRSLENLLAADPGFSEREVLVLELSLPESRYPARRDRYPRLSETLSFYDRVLERIERVPGVGSAAAAVQHPLERGWTTSFTLDGVSPEEGPLDEVRFRAVTPGYFRTVGLPVVQGRPLDAGDRLDAPQVALVNRAFVRRYFPEGGAVGATIRFWGTPREVVGVVGDVRFSGVGADPEPAVYPPLGQLPITQFELLVRSSGVPPLALLPAVRAAIHAVDPDLAPYDVSTLERQLDAAVGQPRLQTALMTSFALLALLLAAIGVYGLVAALVVEERREIGIRMALGAGRGRVLGSVLGRAAGLGLAGLAAGMVGAWSLSGALASLLYGIDPVDPSVYATVGALLLAAAVAAALLPARRATHVDPVRALRTE